MTIADPNNPNETLTMYDTASNAYPPSRPGRIFARYVNGAYVGISPPGPTPIGIDVDAQGIGNCLDVERGDATPTEAPGWVINAADRKVELEWLYCNRSSWGTVIDALPASDRSLPLWWIADWGTTPTNGVPHYPSITIDGVTYVAAACQYNHDVSGYGGTYDVSCVDAARAGLTEYLPGGAPTPPSPVVPLPPTPTPTPPSPAPQEPTVPTLTADIVACVPVQFGYYLVAGDGGVFAFGGAGAIPDNPVPGLKLTRPIVAAMAMGTGLVLVAGDGATFSLNGAPNYGSLPGLGFTPAPESPVEH